MTASAYPDRVALRTKGDEFASTAGRSTRDKVRAAGDGLRRPRPASAATRSALMLTNRPEFHSLDTAAMHLGATPFSVYNTYSPEQIEYLVGDAAAAIVVTEQAFLDRILAVKQACGSLKHVIVVDGDAPDGVLTLDEVAGDAETTTSTSSAWRAVKPDDVLTLIYTSGTTGPPKGVQLTHDNLMQAVRSFDEVIPFPDDGAGRLVPADGAHRRAQLHPLPADRARLHRHLLSRTRARWSATCRRCAPPGSSRCRASGRSSRPRIEAGIEAEQDAERKQATKWALDVGLRKVRAEQAGEEVSAELAQEYAKADEPGAVQDPCGARARRARVAERRAPRPRRAR